MLNNGKAKDFSGFKFGSDIEYGEAKDRSSSPGSLSGDYVTPSVPAVIVPTPVQQPGLVIKGSAKAKAQPQLGPASPSARQQEPIDIDSDDDEPSKQPVNPLVALLVKPSRRETAGGSARVFSAATNAMAKGAK